MIVTLRTLDAAGADVVSQIEIRKGDKFDYVVDPPAPKPQRISKPQPRRIREPRYCSCKARCDSKPRPGCANEAHGAWYAAHLAKKRKGTSGKVNLFFNPRIT